MSDIRKIRLVALVLAALVLLVPTTAYAALTDAPSGTSATNPDADPNMWRQRWGNSLYPHFDLDSPAARGFLYTVDRSALTTINPSVPAQYDRSVWTEGTNFSSTLDLDGIYKLQPVLWDAHNWYPGASQAQEGRWYWHLMAYDVDQQTLNHTYSGVTHTVDFGYDATPPAKVTGLQLYPSATATTAASGVLTQGRANVRWNYVEYDQVAGTAYFQVYVDGKKRLPDAGDEPGEAGAATPWFGTGGTGRVTIEDLPAGRHTFNVSAVDRATNEGLKSSSATIYVDPDIPTVAISAPTVGGTVGPKPTFKAVGQDQAGVEHMSFYVDGAYKGAVTPSAPLTKLTASKTVDLSALSNGTHTLLVKEIGRAHV